MQADDIEVQYDLDARSVHTLLRVIDPADHTRYSEVLFDNLTTPMVLLFNYDWRIRQETIISQSIEGAVVTVEGKDVSDEEALPGAGITNREMLMAWREHASGSATETLLVECYGEPKELDAATA